MDDVLCEALYGVELDPVYSEIEATLTQFEMSANPLAGPDEVIPVNWNLISEQTEELLSRCPDLRVFLWHARARLYCEGISAFFQEIVRLDNLTSHNSSELYPRSEEGGHSGDHAAALGWLSTPRCLAELRTAKLTPEYAYRLCDIIPSETAEVYEKHLSSVASALLTVNSWYQQSGLPDISQQLQIINQSLVKIEAYANQHSNDYQLNCHALCQFLTRAVFQLENNTTAKNISEDILHDKNRHPCLDTDTETPQEVKLTVASRQDVIQLLDKILHYFQRHEPSHPAPILIRRIKKMTGMDFISIVEDLLPGSVDALQQFTGK